MTNEGEQLGRYHLVRKLATGGMAEVFLAKVMGPGGFEKSLVIKRIKPALSKDPEFISMFLQEARLAAQFAHPAVVQIFDFGEVNGSYFLAMEFVDGPNLRSILRAAPDRRLPLAVGARVIEEACEGLAYVHEFADPTGQPLGLMHCDVSTDNLLIARNGAVKVVDFGVAKSAGDAANDAPGTVKGKIAYMPPEQIIGEADLRADVYALGVILYELATGTRPYEQLPDPQLLAAIIQTDPVPLLSRRPDVPREFANIVSKAMAKNLSQRFQSCRELALALDEFIVGSGQRVGTRQLAALATQYEEPPGPRAAAPGTPALATPLSKHAAAGRVSPPLGVPRAAPPRADPFASFGAPVAERAPAPVSAPSSPGLRAEDLFGELVAELDQGEPEGMQVTVGTASARVPHDSQRSTPSGLFKAFSPAVPAVSPSGQFRAAAPAPPSTSASGQFKAEPAPPARLAPAAAQGSGGFTAASSHEARAAVVTADASSMRLYEPGPPLASTVELDTIRRELERDEGLHLLVRFACHAHQLLRAATPAPLEVQQLVAERVGGAVEGLLLAEAWGSFSTLLERLRATADIDPLHRWVFDVACAQLATADQARRIAARLREAPPADAEGLGRLVPFFGPGFAELWLTLFENIDLPASREAVLPGLAGLAGLNAAPFLERLAPKRPRRLQELMFCLEKGRVADRHRVTRELLKRLDPGRRREALAGLAHAGTDDALRLVCQTLVEAPGEDQEATRVHAAQLLGKHFPERAFKALEPLLKPDASGAWTDAERRAMWVAVGQSNTPAAFEAVVAEVNQRAPLLGRAKADARKVEALEALAVMQAPEAAALLRRLADDGAQSQAVRAAADRHVRAAALIESTTTHALDSRRWDRNPITWRDVLIDLAGLAAASRLVELDSASFDVAFVRVSKYLAALLPAGAQASVSCVGGLKVNGEALGESGDATADRVLKALQSRGVSGFDFTAQPPRAELEHLVRWLASGAAAEALETPSLTLTLSTQAVPRPPSPPARVPPMNDLSRETMIRYAELVLGFRSWLTDRRRNPRAPAPEVASVLRELAAATASRAVRFAGLTPRRFDRDAELYHCANVLLLSLLFGAELGLQEQLTDLATCAFFADVGNFELKDETFERAGRLSEAEQREVAAAKHHSARFPFLRLGDKPGATAWAAVVLEQELDWASKDRAGGTGAHASVGLMGSLVALVRAWETLTSPSATREAMTQKAALEVLTQKVPHRFRPELLPLFARFVQRLSVRPLGG